MDVARWLRNLGLERYWRVFGADHADDWTTFVQQFLSCPASLSGNVGVSLSGGGSRALAAGMGQLRALRKLTLHGQSLLAQVKALSVVSGGAWLGVPYVYLPPGGPSDTSYLGPWIEDQAALTPEMLEVPPRGMLACR